MILQIDLDIFDQVIDKVDVVCTEVESSGSCDPHMDAYIAIKAHKRGKELKPLENELVVSSTMPPGHFEDLIKGIKNKFKNRNLFITFSNTNVEEIKKLKLTEIFSRKSDEYTHEEKMYLTYLVPPSHEMNEENKTIPLIDSAIKRNFFWMPDMLLESNQKQKASLRNCGAAHNAGRYGLPNLLAYEGYTLRPLIKTAPVSKRSIIRNLVFGEGNTLFKRVVDKEKARQDSMQNGCRAIQLKT